MTERLTTLQAVKEWLSISADTEGLDAGLTRVIDAASQFALGYMNRDSLQATTYTQTFRGNGKQSVLLRNWPILSVSEIGIQGSIVGPATIGQGGLPRNGFTISDLRDAPQSIDLHGHQFWYQAWCSITYKAGFETSQTMTIPAPVDPATTGVLTPTKMGQWTYDLGVTIDGEDAELVPEDPQAGEYATDGWGTYFLSADDQAKTAVISYCYAPWDLALGVTQTVGEWYKRKDRIGLLSKTLGGQETVTFTNADLTDAVRSMIQPYRNVVPV